MKICKDGRIWGQTNKRDASHLGISTGRSCIPKGLHRWNGARAGNMNPRWNGGRKLTKENYVLIYCPTHPHQVANYVPQHRLVAESVYGLLPKLAIVHHFNGNTQDNHLGNLLICTPSYHKWLHLKMKREGKCIKN